MNKTVRNVFIASLISASIIGSAALATPAAAQSVGDLQKQIQELLAKLTALQEQLRLTIAAQGNASSSSAPVSDISFTAVPRICKIFPEHALALGNRGEEVLGLQEFLQAEGYFTASGTGFFGPLTRDALARWQAAQGFEAAGAMGPLTRERIRARCDGNQTQQFTATPTRGAAPLTVTFNTWLSGFRVPSVSYTIDYGDGSQERAANCPAPADACVGPGQNTHTYVSDGVYTATLNRVTDPCYGQPACRAAIHSEVIAKIQISVGQIACTKEYRPVCGQKQVVCITTPCNPVQQTYGNRCMAEADGATVLYEGQCRPDATDPAADPRCKSWYDGCNTCSRQSPGSPAMCTLRACTPESMTKPYCTSYFDGTGGNRPPTISAFSGPTTLSANESGTWTVRASDPENESLSYSVTWGDEHLSNVQSGYGTVSAQNSFVQTTTFTHAYARAGTYTVVVVVRDASGQEAKTSTTVRVGQEQVACTMEYAPVCGRPTGCANTCPPGQYCALLCRLHDPVTYGNRCQMNAAGATFLHQGECTANSSSIY